MAAGHPDNVSRQPGPVLVGRPQQGPSEVPQNPPTSRRPSTHLLPGKAPGAELLPLRHFHHGWPRALQGKPKHPGLSRTLPIAAGCPRQAAVGAPHGTRSGSEQPSGQSTLFNPAEGNTSSFPSHHLFSVAYPGNTRPFYLLRKEEITTTFLLGSPPHLAIKMATSVLQTSPGCWST